MEGIPCCCNSSILLQTVRNSNLSRSEDTKHPEKCTYLFDFAQPPTGYDCVAAMPHEQLSYSKTNARAASGYEGHLSLQQVRLVAVLVVP